MDVMRGIRFWFLEMFNFVLALPAGFAKDDLRGRGTDSVPAASYHWNRRMSGSPKFAELVDEHYDSLYRFAVSLTQSEADACDLVQETFYIWARKGDQLRQATKVKSWLFTTLHREFLQTRRRKGRFTQVEIGAAEPELPDVPEINWNRLDGQELVRLLQQIDEVFRAPLALFYLEDLSYHEIGEALELPLGTVKSRLSRGVAQLKHLLGRDIEAAKGGCDE